MYFRMKILNTTLCYFLSLSMQLAAFDETLNRLNKSVIAIFGSTISDNWVTANEKVF